ncbi:selenoprotein BthD [Drosophila erecta]|uniref:Selenoprotein BthD n=1 Tax=Drosophila erecta TaxID=7220 RepID=B3NMF4_DROER|nr:selenoprotein BthD [Drosophila erecta]EDV54825.1 uncharacterized protein Dere_GG21730 [Drosophila erecta]
MPDKRPLDPLQPVLYIDHCRYRQTYRKQALHLHSSLAEALKAIQPRVKLQLRINDKGPPQDGSFEVAVAPQPTDDSRARQSVWTGLRRMPSASKVPHVDDILTPVCFALQLRDPHKESHRRMLTNLRHNEGSRARRRDIKNVLNKT